MRASGPGSSRRSCRLGGLGYIIWLVVDNFGGLLGFAPGTENAAVWAFPAAYGAVAVIGVVWALILRVTRREDYDSIGLGARATHPGRGPGLRAAVSYRPRFRGPDTKSRGGFAPVLRRVGSFPVIPYADTRAAAGMDG